MVGNRKTFSLRSSITVCGRISLPFFQSLLLCSTSVFGFNCTYSVVLTLNFLVCLLLHLISGVLFPVPLTVWGVFSLLFSQFQHPLLQHSVPFLLSQLCHSNANFSSLYSVLLNFWCSFPFPMNCRRSISFPFS